MTYKKILLKIVLFFPFYFLMILAFDFMFKKSFNIITIAFISVVVSVIQVISNIFDYDFYNDIQPEDYLESKHNIKLLYNDEKWNRIKEIKKINNYKLQRIESNDTVIKYEIILKRINSIIEFKKEENSIIVNIEKKFLTFVPDKALNYKIIRKVLAIINC